jgi:type II secretory pathway component GspD/PulD (secretin)
MTWQPTGLLALFLVLTAVPAGAQERIELIELRNRPAAEVANIVRPLLSPEDALTVDGNTLILRAAPARITEVRRVVEQIDRAPRNLMISVRRATAAEAERLELEARARATGGDSTLTIGDATSDGVTVSTEQRYSTRRESDVQRLRVLEGNRALIQVGESVPYPQASITVGPWGSAVSGGIEYKDIGTGFLVLPRLNGETVTLEVEQIAEHRRGSDGAIAREASNTVVSGRVGDWIEISGTARTGDERSGRVLSTRRDRDGDEFSILVRVEPVD